MASPIVGALFLGMFTGTPGSGIPPGNLFAGLPAPQCVQCGPASRRNRAVVYDWSGARARASYLRQIEGHSPADGEAGMAVPRIGITEQQARRLMDYAGV